MPNQDDSGCPSQFSAALERLKQLIDIEESDSIQPLGNAAVYKTSVVFWLMLFQRLTPDSSLKQAEPWSAQLSRLYLMFAIEL